MNAAVLEVRETERLKTRIGLSVAWGTGYKWQEPASLVPIWVQMQVTL